MHSWTKERLFRRGHHDLDQAGGIGEFGLDTGTDRQVFRVGPRGPYFVHRGAIANIRHPDIGRQHF